METNVSDKMMSKNFVTISHVCARCSKYGNFVCERCDEPYCSRICQVQDWREHRRVCIPIPRLIARPDHNAASYPINRMLMDASGSYDATDALGSISESSYHGDSTVGVDGQQVTKLTNTLNRMQIDNNAAKAKMSDPKLQLSEIEEVLSTPPVTPKKAKSIKNDTELQVDENANHKVDTIQVTAPPKKPLVLSPPPKKQQHFKPSMEVIQPRMKVFIVHVENHKTINVIPCAGYEQWQQLIKKTNEYASHAKALKNPPEIGYIVLAKPKNCNNYGRCLVKKIRTKDEFAKVEFLEYGFTEVVNFSDLKCLPEELVNAPRLVNTITSKGLADEMEHSDEIERYLVSLQENQTELIISELQPIEKSDVSAHFYAVLVDGTKFTSIIDTAKNLVSIEPAQKIEIDDIPESPKKSDRVDIEYVPFSGDNLKLFILDNSFLQLGCFSAVQQSDMAQLSKIDDIINKNATTLASGTPYHPRDSETCLAQSMEDGRWYRANVQQKIDQNTYQLMYIDYGNMETLTVDRIREMSEDDAIPCITALCFLDGLDEKIDQRVVNRLKELLPQYSEMTFDKVKHTGEEAVCSSTKILGTLKAEGLL